MSDSGKYEYQYNAQQGPPSGHQQAGELKTDFAMGKDMDQMKAMVAHADPVTVSHVAEAWATVKDQLVGEGGAKGLLEAAVGHILQHWEGDSADGFAAQAKKISQKITDGAKYAEYTSTAMAHAASVLTHVQREVRDMHKPSESSSLLDHGKDLLTGGGRDDSGLKADLASGTSTQQALDNNRGDLSKGKEAQLGMAVKMEELAVAYSAQTKAMGSWTKTKKPQSHLGENDDDYPGDPGGTPPVAFVPVAVDSPSTGTSSRRVTGRTGTSPSPKSDTSLNSLNKSGSREQGVSGGVAQQNSKPQVGTGLDSFSGSQGGGSGTGGGTSGMGSAGRGSAGGSTSGGMSGSTPGGLGGVSSRSIASGGVTAGRTGVGGRGMPGSGSSAGGSGASKSGTGKGSSLARQRGGVVGESKGGAGKGSQGGSGLHKSRGGKDAGKVGKGSSRLGGRGANTEAEEEETRQSKRPDYLVEDEETWVPERDVAPRVIE
ncbi:hypothetical protein OG607_18235 [Streptomyces sp. NBC_01537]|uniref:WXG100 family type VII secretion target n=1 Tax=Streptomyces sp. NBC_01537 TaxID=2903896 RepID=UPI00386EE593